jgi:hypothetical protein
LIVRQSQGKSSLVTEDDEHDAVESSDADGEEERGARSNASSLGTLGAEKVCERLRMSEEPNSLSPERRSNSLPARTAAATARE